MAAVNISLEFKGNVGAQLERAIDVRLTLVKQQVAQKIGRNAAIILTKTLQNDARKQLLSQGSFLGRRYEPLSNRYGERNGKKLVHTYAEKKAIELARQGRIELPRAARGIIAQTRAAAGEDTLNPARAAVIAQVAQGTLGARILELNGELFRAASETVIPRVSFSSEGVRIRIDSPISYIIPHQEGATLILPNGETYDMPARKIFRTSITGLVNKLVKGGEI